uniref:hypothetical protein n=1 Tax=Cephaleuros parasiticus TaxID=173370 RepID=UPI001EE00173|nr:hypothetical protein MFQ79_pgp013 [Cephaleuros parasiticus]UIB39049.1 hypothetical protein [Cephaleuros parasiticus]
MIFELRSNSNIIRNSGPLKFRKKRNSSKARTTVINNRGSSGNKNFFRLFSPVFFGGEFFFSITLRHSFPEKNNAGAKMSLSPWLYIIARERSRRAKCCWLLLKKIFS